MQINNSRNVCVVHGEKNLIDGVVSGPNLPKRLINKITSRVSFHRPSNC